MNAISVISICKLYIEGCTCFAVLYMFSNVVYFSYFKVCNYIILVVYHGLGFRILICG